VPTEEEFVMYLNHPGDALKTIRFVEQFGNPNQIPLDVWFEGLEQGRKLLYRDGFDKPHEMEIFSISEPDEQGVSLVRYNLDHEFFSYPVQVAESTTGIRAGAVEMVDPDNPYHVGAPSNGDLWVMHVKSGDSVEKGEELFNITIMKQEKAVPAPMDGTVKRVLKSANYEKDKKMYPVRAGELLVELGPALKQCPTCKERIDDPEFSFCPHCGQKV
jgi:pyruvate carboxylase